MDIECAHAPIDALCGDLQLVSPRGLVLRVTRRGRHSGARDRGSSRSAVLRPAHTWHHPGTFRLRRRQHRCHRAQWRLHARRPRVLLHAARRGRRHHPSLDGRRRHLESSCSADALPRSGEGRGGGHVGLARRAGAVLPRRAPARVRSREARFRHLGEPARRGRLVHGHGGAASGQDAAQRDLSRGRGRRQSVFHLRSTRRPRTERRLSRRAAAGRDVRGARQPGTTGQHGAQRRRHVRCPRRELPDRHVEPSGRIRAGRPLHLIPPADGRWGELVNLGDTINSDQTDYCPMVTPDGKYLFYSRRWGATWAETTAGDVFWVDAGVLDQFRR
jgi:hypothetical protein